MFTNHHFLFHRLEKQTFAYLLSKGNHETCRKPPNFSFKFQKEQMHHRLFSETGNQVLPFLNGPIYNHC